MFIIIWHVNNIPIPTKQFCTGLSRKTPSKSYMLSLTGCLWDFQNNALWDIDWHAILWQSHQDREQFPSLWGVDPTNFLWGLHTLYLPKAGAHWIILSNPRSRLKKNSQKDIIYSQKDSNYSKIMKKLKYTTQNKPRFHPPTPDISGGLGYPIRPRVPVWRKAH